MKEKRKFVNQSVVSALKVIRVIMCILPYFVVNGIIKLIGFFVYFFMGNLKKICKKNMTRIYKSDLDDHVKKVIKGLGWLVTDVLYYTGRPHKLMPKVVIHNEDVLKKALKKGKGVVCPSAHIGNFPLMFIALVQKGYKVNVIIRPMRNPGFGEYVHQLCAERDINMIETLPSKKMLKESFQVIRNNELLFIMLDEVVDPKVGVKVPFFNEMVYRAKGAWLYNKKFDSPIVPGFIGQDDDGIYHIQIEDEISVPSSVTSEDVAEYQVMAAFTYVLQKWIQKYPYQWGGWLNKKW